MSDWTEKKVASEIARHFEWWNNLVVPNVTDALGLAYEADLAIVRKSDWAEVVEIKVSVSDFRAEFKEKPRRHRCLVDGCPAYVVRPMGFKGDLSQAEWAALLEKPTTEVASLMGGPFGVYDWSNCTKHRTRRFWFAMPIEVAEKVADDIPDHAGLIVLEKYSYGIRRRVLKPAPNLKMAEKVTVADRSKMLRAAYYRFWKHAAPLSEPVGGAA